MMTDMEAQAVGEQVEAGKPEEPTPEDQASVGVLGWLGFVIINFAAWGMITLSSSISWILGFFICLIYTMGLIGLALWLQRKGQQYHQFQNLLWVLGCWFVLILGVYFSVQVIGNGDNVRPSSSSSSSIPPIPGDGTLSNLLPMNASADLQNWANDHNWRSAPNPTFASFEDNVFFSGADDADGMSHLMHSNGNSLNKVTPSLRDAHSFLEYRSSLFFAAQQNGFAGESLWRVDASNLSTAISITLSGGYLQMFVDVVSNRLYIKSSYSCPVPHQYIWVDTILRTDGTAKGTEDLRGLPCASISDDGQGDDGDSDGNGKPALGVFWGVLFLGDFPMMALACFIFVQRKMPGLFVNLFGGIHCAAIVMYLLINYHNDNPSVSLFSFIKWFTTIFTSTLWVGIALVSSLKQDLSEWQEELKSWAVAVVGVSFFVIIHVDLEVPFRQDWWRWVTYALLTFAQMTVSMVVSRSVPMVAGALGTFVIAWKIAFEIVQLMGIEGSLAMLIVLALFALQGVGIILLAIYYAGRRSAIDEKVRQAFQFRKAKTAEPIDTAVVDVTKE